MADQTPTTVQPDNDPVVSYQAPGAAAQDADPVVGYAPPAAPSADRWAIGEIGTGLARGALSDLPILAGQAAQYAGANNVGAAMRGFGERMGQNPSLTLNPAAHGPVVNALASGAEQLPAVGGSIALGLGAVAAAPVELPALAALGAAAIPGAALFAGQAGQQTLEKAQAKGVNPDDARTAANLNAAATFATQVGLGMAGGKILGAAGSALSRATGKSAAPLASDILDQMTGQGGIMAPVLKNAAAGAAEAVGAGAVQAGTSAAIENAYGVDNQDPLEAAKDAIVPMLGLSAMLTPFGLAGRALSARAAANRTALLSSADTSAAMRNTLADRYAEQLATSGHPDDVAAAQAFRQNAQTAIDTNQPLQVTTQLFQPGAVEAPQAPQAAQPVPLLPAPTHIVFPNGQVARNAQDVNTYINGLPEDQRVAARAQLLGYGAQPGAGEAPQAAAEPPRLAYNPTPTPLDSTGAARAYTFPDGSSTNDFNQVQSYLEGLPTEQRAQARAKIFGFEPQATTYDAAEMPRAAATDAMRQIAENPNPDLSAKQAIETVTGVDRDGLSKQDVAKRRADAAAALDEPSGVRSNDENGHERELSMGELYELRNRQAEQAQDIARDPNAARPADAIRSDVDVVNQANGFDTKAQSMMPFTKRLDTLGLDKLDSHAAQIDTLSGYLADKTNKMSGAVRDRMTALLNKWQAEQQVARPAEGSAVTPEQREAPATATTTEPAAAPSIAGEAPPQADALPANINASVQDVAPPQAAALPTNIEEHPVTTHLRESAGMVDQALSAYDTRLEAGEQLTPAENEHMQDLMMLERSTNKAIETGDTSANAQFISETARDAAQSPNLAGYAPGRTRAYRTTTPETPNPQLIARTGKLSDTLANLQAHGSAPWVKNLADKLAPLTADTKLYHLGDHPNPDTRGQFDPQQNTIGIYTGGETEHAVLHEAVHAATEARITAAEQMTQPHTQQEAKMRQAYQELDAIRQEAQRSPDAAAQYGLANVHEFVAELNTNPAFQEFLKGQGTQKTWWQRTVDSLRKLIGLGTDSRDALEKALSAQEAFFQHGDARTAGFPLPENSPQQMRYMRTYAGAAKTVDDQYSKLAGLADKIKNIDFGKLNLATFKASLGWKTAQFIADRVRALPEMVQSGFAAGVDSFQAAHQMRREAAAAFEQPLEHYTVQVKKMLSGLDADKARDLSRQMMTIGGEASRMGFDFRLNYNDNVKAGRQLDGGNKAYVDDIHRQFTQLQRTNPDAAKAIEQGELLNRRTLILKAASVLRNLIDASGDATMAPHATKLDFMSTKGARNTDTARYADGMSAELAKRLDAAFADSRKLPQGAVLRDQVNELADMYHAQSQSPYFSLGRAGDYFVSMNFDKADAATLAKVQDALRGTNKVVGDLSQQPRVFFRVDSADQAAGIKAKLEQAGGSGGAWGRLTDQADSAAGVSPALRQLLGSLHEAVERQGITGDAASAMRDTITRELLSMLPETSSRSALMQRRGVPGYDADFLGNFARRSVGGAQDTANIYTQGHFADARKQMDTAITQLNRTGSADGRQRAQLVADEMNLRLANSQKPIDNTTINLINAFGHTFYLAASPAYLIRTTAQPFHRGLPILGARYGFVPAAKEIGKATGTALKIMGNTIRQGYAEGGARGVLEANMAFKDLGLTASEQQFVQELHDRGVLNLGQARVLQSMTMSGPQWRQDVTRMASMTAQYAEMTNRLAVGLAAFRMAEKSNPLGDAAKSRTSTDWAMQTIERAMDNFDPTNTARAIGKHGFAGRWTPLMTAFMNYNLQTMQQIARTVHDGLFSGDAVKQLQARLAENPNDTEAQAGLAATQQRAKEARREFGGLMGTTAMISGALGLPFVNAFAGVWNTFADMADPNDPRDMRIDVQNFLAKTFGHTAGEILAHGLPRGVGFDSSTFGLENLMPGSEFLSSRRMLSDRIDELGKTMMGPAISAGVGVFEAADKIKDGYLVKGVEAALPSGLKPYFKAAELAAVGYTDSKGNPTGLKATPWDVGLQAVGFKSAKGANQAEAAQWVGARGDRLTYQRGLIEDSFYKAALSNNPAQMDAASNALVNYNQANPYEPILDASSGIASRYQKLALGVASGTGVPMSVRQLPSLASQLLFATDGNNVGMP